MALSAEQRRVLATIKQVGRKRRVSPMELKAAVETGLVENNLTNRKGGDRDSSGWRQERASLYKDPDNLTASVNRFFDETGAVKAKYGRAGDLAAAVQRPAAQYRGRYQERSGEADALIGRRGGGRGASGLSRPAAGTPGTPPTVSTQVVPDDTARRQAIATYLLDRDRPDRPNALATALAATNAATRTETTVTPGTPEMPAIPRPARTDPSAAPSGAGGAAAAVNFAASKIGGYAEPGGNNRGPELDRLQSRFGFKGAPWCAMFTSVAVTRGGAPKSARTASVAAIRGQVQNGNAGYQRGFKPQPKAGDLMLFGNGHVVFVEKVNGNGTVTILGGNESSNKVQRRVIPQGRGEFARPKYAR